MLPKWKTGVYEIGRPSKTIQNPLLVGDLDPQCVPTYTFQCPPVALSFSDLSPQKTTRTAYRPTDGGITWGSMGGAM